MMHLSHETISTPGTFASYFGEKWVDASAPGILGVLIPFHNKTANESERLLQLRVESEKILEEAIDGPFTPLARFWHITSHKSRWSMLASLLSELSSLDRSERYAFPTFDIQK